MKKLIVFLIIAFCSIAIATVQLNFSIPDEHVSRVIDALRACENTHVHIHFQGSADPNDPNKPDFSLDVNYRLDAIEGETHQDYGMRFIKTMIREVIKAYEQKVADEQRQEQINAIPIVDVNVPDEVIQ